MKHRKQSGFTIVELLIVIVVIAILAAISIVAFNGVQDRARATSAFAGAATYLKGIDLYRAANGAPPLEAAEGVACFSGQRAGCHSLATDTSSQKLKNALADYIDVDGVTMPYPDSLVSYHAGRMYIYFSIPANQDCPTSVGGKPFYTYTLSNERRQCRYYVT